MPRVVPSIFPAITIANSYRKQLFEPFFSSRLFGVRPHLYLNSNRVLKCHGFEKFIYRFLTKICSHLVVSDLEGFNVIQKLNPQTQKPIYWFGWNSIEETTTWKTSLLKKYVRLKLCFLFPEVSSQGKSENYPLITDFKFPILNRHKRAEKKHTILYMGEVDLFENLANINPQMHDYLWDIVYAFKKPDLNTLGYFSEKISISQAMMIYKNRIRYHYVDLLKKDYGNNFILVGNDWKKTGLESFPAEYNPKKRFQLYSNSHLCLDFLSKSSDAAHYPRSAEIISHSNGMIQLKTIDSEQLFGDQINLRTFENYSELKLKIEQLLSKDRREFSDLGEKLRKRLICTTQKYNYEHI